MRFHGKIPWNETRGYARVALQSSRDTFGRTVCSNICSTNSASMNDKDNEVNCARPTIQQSASAASILGTDSIKYKCLCSTIGMRDCKIGDANRPGSMPRVVLSQVN